MNIEGYHIGIDTSNYTTSLAVSDADFNIVSDMRHPLEVKSGCRGLRQSEALFQHMRNLPDMIGETLGMIDRNKIRSIGVSSRPRSIDGSYMPVFNAGVDYGKVMGYSLDIPFYLFSHQEGHLEAVRKNSPIDGLEHFIALHLSGGTCEILLSEYRNNHYDISIIGGSRDLSFGQIIDRIGVAMGLPFPAGMALDALASGTLPPQTARLKKIRADGAFFNISGLENQCMKLIEQEYDKSTIAYVLFESIASILCNAMENALKISDATAFLMAGGVSSSEFIRSRILEHFAKSGAIVAFGERNLSSDNAVGISFLAASKYAQTGGI